MPYFDNDGVKIYYEIEGEGPGVNTLKLKAKIVYMNIKRIKIKY